MCTAFSGARFAAARFFVPDFRIMSTHFSALCIFILSKTLFKKSKTGLFTSLNQCFEIEYSSFR